MAEKTSLPLISMYKLKLLIIIFSLIARINARQYENYTLYRGIPLNRDHLEFFGNLSESYDVSYWREPGSLRMPVEFSIAPTHKEPFLREANAKGIYLTTLMDDIQSAFDMQTVQVYIRRRMDTFNWDNYYRLSDMYQWLQDLERAYPKEVFIESIGKTHEERDILAVKVILRGSFRRSKVIVEGGIHAREWISPAFVTYMIHSVVRSSQQPNSLLWRIAINFEWYFVPVLNPDGYEYTHTEDRLWRKNRHGTGVDLNRNFGFGFAKKGVSFNKTSEIYCGDKAFSEKESDAMAKFATSKKQDLLYYLSFHSYGQFIILPYGHSVEHMENYDEMKRMGLEASRKIKSKYKTEYRVGTAYDTVGYLVGGSSTCWVKKSLNVPYAVTFELRDKGNFGFALPTKQILPTCEETMEGIMSLLEPKATALSTKKLFNGSGLSFGNKLMCVFPALAFIRALFG